MDFERQCSQILTERLNERPRHLVVVAGPRQVGKTTLARQTLARRPHRWAAADKTGPDPGRILNLRADVLPAAPEFVPGAAPTAAWLEHEWKTARALAQQQRDAVPYVLVVDEVQKIPRWSEVVKGLWDADRADQIAMHVVLLGSSPWLINKGLTESLAGRFELIRMVHWSFTEMQEAFDLSLDEYVYFGGYPGSADLRRDERRWRAYVRDALIYTSVEKDILQLTRVDKPALLRTLFELGCAYSGQIISYTKLLGQLQDAGNTVTLAHYLTLLSQAGLLTGLSKYAGRAHRQRASSPKLTVLNTALMSALGDHTFAEARSDRSYWGRLVESAVGAHLCNTVGDDCQVQYWRESPHEVDFVLSRGKKIAAIEVKSSARLAPQRGLAAFLEKFEGARSITVGEGGISLDDFLSHPARHWLE